MRTLALSLFLLFATITTAQSPCDTSYTISFTASDDGGGLFSFDGSNIWGSNVHIWNYGDGQIGTGPLSSHYYSAPGDYEVCLEVGIAYGNDSCWRSVCQWVTVGGNICDSIPVQANFTAQSDGNWVIINNQSQTSGYAATYNWSFGDGWGTSAAENPIYQYVQPGTYQVCLELAIGPNNGQDSCFSYHCETITVGTSVGCDSTFFVTFGASAQGNQVFFSSTSGGQADGYVWSFGDGTMGYGQSTQHSYQQAGQYYACVDAWYIIPNTSDTCWTSECQWVTVGGGQDCDSTFAVDFTPVSQGGGYMTFTASGNLPVNDFIWDFGDGTPPLATGSFSQHYYTDPGDYQVCVIGWYFNQNGLDTCWADHCEWINIGGNGNDCDSLFNAEFTWISLGNGVVVFDNGTFTNGYPTSYFWDFGDGSYGWGEDPVHTYLPGQYQVCLEAWYWNNQTQDSCFSQVCHWIWVDGADPCDSILEAFFVPSQFQSNTFFFNNGTWSADPNNTQYFWDFGDGNYGNTHSPTHTYADPGNYEVCLTAWVGNCADTLCTTIVVQGGSVCDSIGLSAYFTYNQFGNIFDFTNLSATGGYDAEYYWDFGDGETSTDEHPVHDYQQPGIYTPCLYVEIGPNNGQDSCFSMYCHTVVVNGGGGCDSTFFTSFTSFDQGGQVIVFNGTSSIPASQFIWDFGDGQVEYSGAFTQHYYDTPGTYYVCLQAWYYDQNIQDSCWAEFCDWVFVGGNVDCDSSFVADYSWYDVGNGVVEFIDQTNTGGQQVWYLWDFGDGGMGYQQNEVHTYAQPGQYYVCLSAWYWNLNTQDTCWSEQCSWITVGGGNNICDSLLFADFHTIDLGNGAFAFNDMGYSGGVQTWYTWDFGDGTFGYDQNEEHTYAFSGYYWVCQTANTVDQNGYQCTDSTCTWIYVDLGGGTDCDSSFQAAFTWQDVPGVGVEFFNSTNTNGHQAYYLWDFGDGNMGYNEQEFHSYAQPGQYLVCLSAWYWNQNTQDTCWSEQCSWVTVGDGGGCDSTFSTSFTWFDQGGQIIVFNGMSSIPANQFIWYFGDGQEEYGSAFTQHYYDNPGYYTVCVEAWYYDQNTQDSCWSEFCDLIYVSGMGGGCDSTFIADFNWYDSGNGVVEFENLTNTGGQQAWFQWDFGDGSMGYNEHEVHTYTQPGSYTVCLSAWYWDTNTQDTCWSTNCQTIGLVLGVYEGSGAFEQLQLYPNPGNQLVHVAGLSDIDHELVISDSRGRVIEVYTQGNLTNGPLDLRGLESGVYFFQFHNPQGQKVLRYVLE